MIGETEIIELAKGIVIGIKIKMPKTNFLFIQSEKGYAGCGYFNEETIEKLGDAAVIAKGVKSVNEMLVKKVDYVSPKARKMGINKRMTVRQALERMM